MSTWTLARRAERLNPSIIREILKVTERPGIISLAGGLPYEELVPYYHLRHVVRPGLSGWAQANGLRGPTTGAASACSRIDHDIAYIQNQSLLLDFKIILRTMKSEFLSGSGS